VLSLGKFVSYMRARPSDRQDELAEREFAARLVSQFARLAAFLCVVMNRTSVDDEVMRPRTPVRQWTPPGALR